MNNLVGYPFPLGTNFSVFSEIAERVQLCLFMLPIECFQLRSHWHLTLQLSVIQKLG